MYLQIYVDGFAGIGGGIDEIVTMEADGVGGELHHCALPRHVGGDGGCADGNHGGEDLPIAGGQGGWSSSSFSQPDSAKSADIQRIKILKYLQIGEVMELMPV